MAETPEPDLRFAEGCDDCGQREVELPGPLPPLGDDFDWLVRDYDGFRLFMLEELAARFSERSRWTPADMEVVVVEALAVVLDQLSDMLDRAHSEAFLETARRPDSVRRLLAMIGYDAVQAAGYTDLDDPAKRLESTAALEFAWRKRPHLMEAARTAGPPAIHTQKRMVTEQDHAERLEEHLLVARGHAFGGWTGSWTTIRVAVVTASNAALDEPVSAAIAPGQTVDAVQAEIERFHTERGLDVPEWASDPTQRTVLRPYVDAYRMAGQEVFLQDAEPVGIHIALSVRIADAYFQSEVRRKVLEVLGTGLGGFFEPGRLRFGEDVHASDVIEVVSALDGVEAVCLNRFKRVGKRYPDRSMSGRITLTGIEIALCDDDPSRPERGYLRVTVHGGRRG